MKIIVVVLSHRWIMHGVDNYGTNIVLVYNYMFCLLSVTQTYILIINVVGRIFIFYFKKLYIRLM